MAKTSHVTQLIALLERIRSATKELPPKPTIGVALTKALGLNDDVATQYRAYADLIAKVYASKTEVEQASLDDAPTAPNASPAQPSAQLKRLGDLLRRASPHSPASELLSIPLNEISVQELHIRRHFGWTEIPKKQAEEWIADLDSLLVEIEQSPDLDEIAKRELAARFRDLKRAIEHYAETGSEGIERAAGQAMVEVCRNYETQKPSARHVLGRALEVAAKVSSVARVIELGVKHGPSIAESAWNLLTGGS